jgi:hypothetical protein
MQILWERGLIDNHNLKKYPMNGRQDVFGVLIPDTFFDLFDGEL